MGETLAIHLLGPQPSVVRSGQPQPLPAVERCGPCSLIS